MTGASRSGRVLHAIGEYGTVSEAFLAERVVELERIGWEGWVATRRVLNRDLFPHPPDDRLLRPVPSVGARLAARLRRRARLENPAWPMERCIRTARPELVHAHFGWIAAAVLPAVKDAGLPFVAGFHGYDLTVYPRHGFIDLASESAPPTLSHDPYRRLLEDVDCALVVSRFLEGKLRELGFAGRIEVVPSGIRLDEFPFRGPRQSDGNCRVLFVGRQVAYKGLDVLIRALAQLEPKPPGLRLDVIGDGPTRRRSRALAQDHGLGQQVIFHGEQPRAAVRRAMQTADLVVAPSRTMPSGQAEGLSNVIKEALAIGLPVVATANGGIPEAVPPHYREELVPENDPRALAERLASVVDQRSTWEERARIGREWVEHNFDWSRVARQIGSIYDDLTDDAPVKPT